MHSFISKLRLYNSLSLSSFSGRIRTTFSRHLLPIGILLLAVSLSLYGSTSRWFLEGLPTRGQKPGSKSKPVDRKTSRHFGLSQVYPDPNEEAEDTTIDIVAIHGLDTQSPRTWVAWKRDGDESSGETHWLKDRHMLPKVIPNARIFTFDWNANLDSNAAAEDLLGFADSLLDELRQLRGEGSQRPFVFIASCFGGLLLAKALVRADSGRSKYMDILSSTAGIVFLGTPFRGSHAMASEAYQVRVLVALQEGGQGANKLVRYLEQNNGQNENLDELVRLFREMITRHEVANQIVCFYERLPSNLERLRQRLPPAYHDMKLQESGILVDKHSAMLEGLEAHGLDVRHNMLDKYPAPEDKTYKTVSSCLAQMCKEAPQILGKRLHDTGRPRPMYHVVPRFEFPAKDGPLELGTVVDDLATLEPLNRREIIPIPHRLWYPPVVTCDGFEATRSELCKGHESIWAQQYAQQNVEYSGNLSSNPEQDYIVKCDQLITTFFDPDQEYVNKNLSSDSMRDYYSGTGYQGDIYMITGLKVAKNLQMVRPNLSPDAQHRLRSGSMAEAGHAIEFERGDRVVGFRVKKYTHSFNKLREQDNLIYGEMYGHGGSVANPKPLYFDEVQIATELDALESDEGIGNDGDEIWIKGPVPL